VRDGHEYLKGGDVDIKVELSLKRGTLQEIKKIRQGRTGRGNKCFRSGGEVRGGAQEKRPRGKTVTDKEKGRGATRFKKKKKRVNHRQEDL